MPPHALPATAALVAEIQRQLQQVATEEARQFSDRYIPGHRWRGVRMAGALAVVADIWARCPRPALYEAAFALFAEEMQEDRLAGILLLERLVEAGVAVELGRIGGLFASGRIDNWSLCDWMCIRVLARLIERPPKSASQLPSLADIAHARATLASWRTEKSLWQRRATCVAFVPAAKRADAEIKTFILDSCAMLARDPARFAQTGVGWTLRELARSDREAALQFATAHAPLLSAEAIRTVTEHMPEERPRLSALRRAGGRDTLP